MTDPSITPPAEWSEASTAVPGADKTYVYHVGDGERVLVGLVPPSDNRHEFRLEVSSIESAAPMQRHDFAVDTYESSHRAAEDTVSFMQHVSEMLQSGETEDERLFVTVQQCIDAFDTTDSGQSFFSR